MKAPDEQGVPYEVSQQAFAALRDGHVYASTIRRAVRNADAAALSQLCVLLADDLQPPMTYLQRADKVRELLRQLVRDELEREIFAPLR